MLWWQASSHNESQYPNPLGPVSKAWLGSEVVGRPRPVNMSRLILACDVHP